MPYWIMVKKQLNKSLSLLKIIYIIGTVIALIIGAFIFQNWYREYTNPAKQLATIMPPFAKQSQMEKLYEENITPGPGNYIPWFVYTYQTNKNAEEVYIRLKDYLVKNGYKISEYNNKPLYLIEGTITNGAKLNKVTASISTDTYFNYDPNNYGEASVPDGKTILNITFSVN